MYKFIIIRIVYIYQRMDMHRLSLQKWRNKRKHHNTVLNSCQLEVQGKPQRQSVAFIIMDFSICFMNSNFHISFQTFWING